MSTLGEFNLLERNMGLNEVPSSSGSGFDFEFSDITTTANSWLDSLSGTFIKYAEVKNAYENSKNDNTAREYENLQQQVKSTNTVSNNNLVYIGIGIVALFMLTKD